MTALLVILHVLGATVWTGGHLVLALAVLPRVLRERAPDELLRFEAGFEKIGIPALLLQVLTGLLLAAQMLPPSQWLELHNPAARLVCIKLGLLALTALLAMDARLRIIPRLSASNLRALAWHIVPVTLIAVLFVITGVGFRFGWLS